MPIGQWLKKRKNWLVQHDDLIPADVGPGVGEAFSVILSFHHEGQAGSIWCLTVNILEQSKQSGAKPDVIFGAWWWYIYHLCDNACYFTCRFRSDMWKFLRTYNTAPTRKSSTAGRCPSSAEQFLLRQSCQSQIFWRRVKTPSMQATLQLTLKTAVRKVTTTTPNWIGWKDSRLIMIATHRREKRQFDAAHVSNNPPGVDEHPDVR